MDISKEVNFIWNIADKLRGAYTSDKYKDVIIPMVILRRFECALADTKSKVLTKFSADASCPVTVLEKASGYNFYNTSRFDLKELLNDQNNIKANLLNYIDGFSANIKEILANLDFPKQIEKMHKENCLFSIVKAFSELDLDPASVPNHKMGYIFEDIIRRFSENAEAGDHYTGRDIIALMVEILLFDADVSGENRVISVLDQACGTGGMLSVANETIKEKNKHAVVYLYGQEINGESYAICKADMLIKGQKEQNILKTDTLKNNEFANEKFDFIIENPPFGTPWGGEKAKDGVEYAVKKAFEEKSRFLAGLPAKSDAQLLFMQSALERIKDNGKIAIIQNGSPLFSGDTLSGESQIRRYLLENDYIDAIIALPTELFYNTGIATYIWVLRKQKPKDRKGKLALIDASSLFFKLRKAMGNKRNELSKENIAQIIKIYTEFQNSNLCKIYSNSEFIYKEYTIMTPLQKSYSITNESLENLPSAFYNESKLADLLSKDELSPKEQKELEKQKGAKVLCENITQKLKTKTSHKVYLNKDEFIKVLKAVLENDAKTLEKIAAALSCDDENADIQTDKKGEILYDKDSKDSELININADIDEYMKKEVLPHLKGAKAFDENKIGAEIPFTRYFYKYQSPKSTEQIKLEFQRLEKETKELENGLFDE
ncbi:MAG: type I restriction/modification system, methylation subunit [Candidatus Campylobacter infans]|nr:MAG: type I restriction/modification system, methylation subunit [Candidatus Campylobacter infans]